MLDIDTVYTASEEANICLKCPNKHCKSGNPTCTRLRAELEKLKRKKGKGKK